MYNLKSIVQHIVITLLFFVASNCWAQNKEEKLMDESNANSLIIVEQMPEFIGGQDSMFNYINEQIIYPLEAKNNKKEGIVYLGFIVDKEGKITNTSIKRGIANAPELDQEALRVLNNMPAWKPGKQNGKAVNVAFTLPIKFQLAEKK